MGWVLIWLTMSGSGVVTSGSAHFASAEACLAGQKAYSGLAYELTKGMRNTAVSQSSCVSEQTGEERTGFTPRP